MILQLFLCLTVSRKDDLLQKNIKFGPKIESNYLLPDSVLDKFILHGMVRYYFWITKGIEIKIKYISLINVLY